MILYSNITLEEINIIKDLWEANRAHHINISKHFSEQYASIIFDDRMRALSKFDKGNLMVTAAIDEGNCVGYCISVIAGGKGELVSMHVSESNRGNGIGKNLVNRHICWMKERHCMEIGVSVSNENEASIKFYRSAGFFPDTLYMKQIK